MIPEKKDKAAEKSDTDVFQQKLLVKEALPQEDCLTGNLLKFFSSDWEKFAAIEEQH